MRSRSQSLRGVSPSGGLRHRPLSAKNGPIAKKGLRTYALP